MVRNASPSKDMAEKRRSKVIEYIKQNPKTTKNNVVNYMTKNGSSLMTTHKILKDLEHHGIIEVEKLNSQMSSLIINENNEFNKINNTLTEIETLVDKMYRPTRIMEDAITQGEIIRNREKYMKFVHFDINFRHNYYDSITAIIHKLVDITNNKIQSEKDVQILYMKIIDILRKIAYQRGHRTVIGELDEANKKFKIAKSSSFIRKFGINTNLIEDTVCIIENFKHQFLIEPHEK